MEFEDSELPFIRDALEVDNHGKRCVMEVAQHIGNHVAETCTGVPGKYVPLSETSRGFKLIIDGELDDYPEQAFFIFGTIDEVIKR